MDANTVTVDDLIFDISDAVFTSNKGAGSSVTINLATGLNLEQYRSALLLAFSASNFSLFFV